MSLLRILHFPDNKLRQKGVNVDVFDSNLADIASNMLETMYHSKGIGLAAIQVNILMRLIVIDVSESRNEPLILVNPIISEKTEEIIFEEGCLSVPGFYEKVHRFNKINFIYNDLQGKKHQSNAEGLLSICIQHEIDHLDGKLFVDYISGMKRDRISKKLQKQDSLGNIPPRKDVPYSI